MKVLGIIPCRKGSKRIPFKNRKLFFEKPLYEHIVNTALKSKKIDTLAISTDDNEILSLSKKFKKLVKIRRPDHLSQDDSEAIGYVKHALKYFKNKNLLFDVVVILQPTSPLTLVEDIDGCIDLLNKSDSDSVVSIVRVEHMIHPVKMKTIVKGKLVPYFEDEKNRMLASQLPDIFVRNCSVYASKTKIIDSGKIIGDYCKGYEMPSHRSVDINNMSDFYFAEFLKGKLK